MVLLSKYSYIRFVNDYMKKRMENILRGRPLKKKEKKPLNKISEKRKNKMDEDNKSRGGGDSELQKWFKARIKHSMVGKCAESGLKTETGVYRYAIMSCCHILPKSQCPSVKYHPLNFIELTPDLHFKWDNISWEERETWCCWPIVRERLIMMWPELGSAEYRNFPPNLRKWIEENNALPLNIHPIKK